MEKLYFRIKKLHLLNNIRVVHWSVASLAFLFLTYFLIATDLPTSTKFEVGKPAPFDARATHTVRLVDEEATAKARSAAAEQVSTVEKFSPYAVQVSEAKIDNTISYAKGLSANSGPTATKFPLKMGNNKEDGSDQLITLPLSEDIMSILASTDSETLTIYGDVAKKLLRQAMSDGIREEEVANVAASLLYKATELQGVSRRCKIVASEMASKALTANLFPDIEATKEAKIVASEQVTPIVKVIVPGQIVLREGEIITKNDLPILEALGFYHHKITIRSIVIKSLLVICLLWVTRAFLILKAPNVYQSNSMICGLTMIVFLYAISSHCMIINNWSPFITPITVPVILLTILISADIGVILGVLLPIYTCAETGDLSATVSAIMVSMVTVLSLRSVVKRWDLIHASLVIWIANIIFISIFSTSAENNWQNWLITAFYCSLGTGLLAPLLAAGLLPFMENLLNITSHMRMMELANPSEPALHELLSKAPGTYQHSLMVGNIAEAAAQAVGADYLLCRTGAYYHDIGKTKQPNMFIENQFGAENPHDKLPASLSAMILTSHVKFGEEMAKQYKLPKAITNFISEHHGTNLASFFYQKAQAESDEPLSEENFRYPGPKPQSKETAIVMICDGIEAASRTLAQPTKENIQALVERMISNIINNGQLDECTLSLQDIAKIKASIVHTLATHYHSRISYPPAGTKFSSPSKVVSNPNKNTAKESENNGISKEDGTKGDNKKSNIDNIDEPRDISTDEITEEVHNSPPNADDSTKQNQAFSSTHTTKKSEEKPRNFPAAQR